VVKAGAHHTEGSHEVPLLSQKAGLPPRHLISVCFFPFWKLKEGKTHAHNRAQQQSLSRKKIQEKNFKENK